MSSFTHNNLGPTFTTEYLHQKSLAKTQNQQPNKKKHTPKGLMENDT